MTLGRRIRFFLCHIAVQGDSFRQETLDHYLYRATENFSTPYPDRGAIETVKWIRRRTLWGLKESKGYLDRLLVDIGLLNRNYFRDRILRGKRQLEDSYGGQTFRTK